MLYWQDLRHALRLLATSPLFTLLTRVPVDHGDCADGNLAPDPAGDRHRAERGAVAGVRRQTGGQRDSQRPQRPLAVFAAVRPLVEADLGKAFGGLHCLTVIPNPTPEAQEHDSCRSLYL